MKKKNKLCGNFPQLGEGRFRPIPHFLKKRRKVLKVAIKRAKVEKWTSWTNWSQVNCQSQIDCWSQVDCRSQVWLMMTHDDTFDALMKDLLMFWGFLDRVTDWLTDWWMDNASC